MPRRSKGARLWLRPARRACKITRRASWIILDRGKHIATGCAEDEARKAEEKLAQYIGNKYSPNRIERDLESIWIADILNIYLEDLSARGKTTPKLRARLARLNEFWGDKKLSFVSGASCRAYVA
jgi:hypothetical protein